MEEGLNKKNLSKIFIRNQEYYKILEVRILIIDNNIETKYFQILSDRDIFKTCLESNFDDC